MQKEAFEPTGLIPRSIIRTVDRFLQQLFPGREKIAVQEYRVSRYQILVSIKTLLTLICVPLLVKYTLKYVLLTPLIEHFWNSYQSEVFLNQYQEKRAFAEMEEFSEKMFFEFLSEPNEVSRATIDPQHVTVAVKQGDECDVWSYKPEVCTSEAMHISDVYKSPICTTPAMYVSNVGYKRPDLLRAIPSEARHQAVLGLVPGLVPTQNAVGRRFGETHSLSMLTPTLGRCPTSTTHVLSTSTTPVLTQAQLTSCSPPAYIAKRLHTSNVSMPTILPKAQLLVSSQPEFFLIKSSTGDQNFAQPLSCVTSTALTGTLNSWGFDTVLPETDHGLVSQDCLHLKDRWGCTNRRFVHTSGGMCVVSDVCVVNDTRALGEGNSCLHGWCNVSLSRHNPLFDEETKSLDDVYQNDVDANLLQTYKGLFQLKSLELARTYNEQSISSIANLLGDFATFFTLYLLVRVMRPEIIILKSFLTESVYSLSDTTKSFLLILGMDLLVGFHSPRAWEIALETFLRHIGLPENENFILLFVALFPVFLDTVFKYWIFRYLNKISPSTVVTYHSMIE